MALADDINALPTTVGDGNTGHLNNHQVIHAALKNHGTRLDGAVSTVPSSPNQMLKTNGSGKLSITTASITSGTDPANKEYVDAETVKTGKGFFFSGVGSPEWNVAAPVGAIYVDTARTAGAIRWIKASGTSTSGWQVQYGDTGWRVLSTDIMTSGGIQVRRINSTVHCFAGSGTYRTFNLSSTSPVSAVGVIPVGFRSDVRVNFIPVILNTSKTTVGALEALESGNVFTRMSSGYTSVDELLQSMNTHWMTTQAWPTVLPGTPA